MWEKFDPNIYANYDIFLKNPKYYWDLERAMIPIFAKAKPNPNHKAVVELEKKSMVDAIITQNIDNFHQMAGSRVPVIELHGSVYSAYCMDRGQRIKRGYLLKSIKQGRKIPVCPNCGGRVKTGAIMFNEPMADDVLEQAREVSRRSDLFLALGSSLQVYPANELPIIAKKAGAKLIYINREETLMDKYCDLRFLGNLIEYFTAIGQ